MFEKKKILYEKKLYIEKILCIKKKPFVGKIKIM